MPDLNKVIMMGRLTKDPVLRYTQNGTAVSDLGLATNRHWKSKEGDKKSEVTYTQVTMWGKQAEIICKFLDKGDPIFIEGRLALERWEGPEGDKRQKTKVMGESFQCCSSREKTT